MEIPFKAGQQVWIETDGGLWPVTVVRTDDDLLTVRYAEGDTAVVRVAIVHASPQQ